MKAAQNQLHALIVLNTGWLHIKSPGWVVCIFTFHVGRVVKLHSAAAPTVKSDCKSRRAARQSQSFIHIKANRGLNLAAWLR